MEFYNFRNAIFLNNKDIDIYVSKEKKNNISYYFLYNRLNDPIFIYLQGCKYINKIKDNVHIFQLNEKSYENYKFINNIIFSKINRKIFVNREVFVKSEKPIILDKNNYNVYDQLEKEYTYDLILYLPCLWFNNSNNKKGMVIKPQLFYKS